MTGAGEAEVQTLQSLFLEHPLFLAGGLLLLGYIAGKLAVRLRLPEISGFIVAGVLIGSFGGIINRELNEMLHIVTEVAISFLALTVGGEFSARKLRRIGRDVLAVTLVGLAGTFLLVLGGCSLLGYLVPRLTLGYPYSILLAVIACATSPAIIAAEVHHMRAHGRFVDYLFGVVALGDAMAVILFGLAFSLVINLLGAGGGHILLGQAVREIFLSLALGAVASLPLAFLVRRVRNQNELMIITVGFVFVVTGITIALHLSPLLVHMMLGVCLVNLPGTHARIFRALEPFTPPIYALFFVIAGLEIDIQVITSAVAVVGGAAYVLLRAFARTTSLAAGCWLRRLPRPVIPYLGVCTLSQGGIALGFVLLIRTAPALDGVRADPEIFGRLVDLVQIVLLSIFANELLSPLFLRLGVLRGNEMEGS